jgi:hypothetical protein
MVRPWPIYKISLTILRHFLEKLVCYSILYSTNDDNLTIQHTYLYSFFYRDQMCYTKPHVYIVCNTHNIPSYFVVFICFKNIYDIRPTMDEGTLKTPIP